MGASATLAPILWLIMHIVRALSGTAGGRLSDIVGKRNALVVGWCFYAVMWAAIGFAKTLPALFVLSAIYGPSDGMVDGAQRGLIADLAAGQKRGAAFGAFNMLIGVASLIASTAFGAVLDRWGSVAAFLGSSVFAIAAAVLLIFLVPRNPLVRLEVADSIH